MATPVKTYCLEDILQGGEVCENPTISIENPIGLLANCPPDSTCIDIQLLPDATKHCVTIIIDCDDCDECPPMYITKCFCDENGDCEECEYCDPDGICVSKCEEGQVCDDGNCGDCNDEFPCECNQVCIQGKCQCPAGQILAPDGCCYDCLSSEDCEVCEYCDKGDCVPKECPDGYCNPNTGECQECLDNGDCTKANECCKPDGTCGCCPGYKRNPETGECEDIDCYTNEDCPECEDCVDGKCQERICPGDKVCVDDECKDSCDGCDDCPDGYGCYNGVCIPCSDGVCAGTGINCEYILCCECVDGECVEGVCEPENVTLNWDYTPPTTGEIINPGLPPIQGTASISASGIESAGSDFNGNFQNHQFNVSVTNSNGGTWNLANFPGDTNPIGSGTSVSFDLSSGAAQYNFMMFIVSFTESATGRTAEWVFYRDPAASILAANVWSFDFRSSGTPPTTTGGTPGQLKLCPSDSGFEIQNITTTETTGTIQLYFTPDGNGCMNVTVSGCGTWRGTADLLCAGQLFKDIPVPEFTIPEDACCDPATDFNCTGDPGEPCVVPEIIEVPLIAEPTFGTTSGGAGEYNIRMNYPAINLSVFEIFYLHSKLCWGATDNGDIQNDIDLSGNGPLGTHPHGSAINVTLEQGGCVTLGKVCTISLSGCRELQGEVCLEKCADFAVKIFHEGDYDYFAKPSIGAPAVTYQWSTNKGLLGMAQTQTIPADATISFIKVVAKNEECTAQDQINISLTIGGCTNPLACNFNANANLDDGSCIFVDPPTYTCDSGLVADAKTENGITIGYQINNTLYYPNDSIAPGTYTVTPVLQGVPCTAAESTLVVPKCYNCANEICQQAATTTNFGSYTDDPNCANQCSCELVLNVIAEGCDEGKITYTVEVSGGSGTYSITVQDASGNQVGSYTNISDSVTIPNLCDQTYTFIADDGNCDVSESVDPNCDPCANLPVSITANASTAYTCADSFNVAKVEFSLVGDDCVTSQYTVQLLSGNTVLASKAFTPGQKTWTSFPSSILNDSGNLNDGTYKLKVIYNVGDLTCSKETTFDVNCAGQLCTLSVDSWLPSVVDEFVDLTIAWSGNNDSGSVDYEFFRAQSGVVICGQTDCSQVVLDPVTPDKSGTATTSVFTISDIPANGQNLDECWLLRLTDSSFPDCVVEDTYCFSVSDFRSDELCTVNGNYTYDEANEGILFSWQLVEGLTDVATPQFTVTLDVYYADTQGGTASCTGTPDLSLSTDTGELLGNTGSSVLLFAGQVPKLPRKEQCLQVTISSPDNPNCLTIFNSITVSACSCEDVGNEFGNDDITIEYIEANELIQVDFSVYCPVDPDNTVVTLQEYTASDFQFTLGSPISPDGIGPSYQEDEVQPNLYNYTAFFSGITQGASDRYFRVDIDNGGIGDSACTGFADLTISNNCDCLLSATNHVYSLADLTLTFDLTTGTCSDLVNITIVDDDGQGNVDVIPTVETNPISVAENSTTSVTLNLTRPAVGDLLITVTAVNDITCVDQDPVEVCVTQDADTIPAYTFYTERSVRFTGNPSDTETVTVNGRVYTFKNAPSVPDDVQIGVDDLATALNLADAINSGATGGAVNADVTATVGIVNSDPHVIFRSNIAGVAGDFTLAEGSSSLALNSITSTIYSYLVAVPTDNGFYDVKPFSAPSWGDYGLAYANGVGYLELSIAPSTDNWTFKYPKFDPNTQEYVTLTATGSGSARAGVTGILQNDVGSIISENNFIGGYVPLTEKGVWTLEGRISITSITVSGTTATVTQPNHGYTTGTEVFIWGANEYQFNGLKVVANVVDADTWELSVPSGTPPAATGTLEVIDTGLTVVGSGCLTISTPGEYLLAFQVDNGGEVFVDGEPAIKLDTVDAVSSDNKQQAFKYCWMTRWYFDAGDHIVSFRGVQDTSNLGVFVGVFDYVGDGEPDPQAHLANSTTWADLNPILDTSVASGQFLPNLSAGTQSGATCPDGFGLYYDGCTPLCTDCPEGIDIND